MGTVHFLRPELDWRSDEIDTALAEADTLVFEADVSSPEAAGEMMDFVSTHALFTEAGHTVNAIDRDALAAAIARLEAGSWIELPAVEPQPGRLYRVAVAGTVIASGAPLRMMQSAEPTALFSDATGMMYSAPWDATTTPVSYTHLTLPTKA